MKLLFGSPSYQANIPRFLITRAFSNAMFFLPIWVIFVQGKHGIDLVQVTLLDSAFWLSMVLTEIPTGAIADTMGRKHSYAIGTILSALGLLLFALSPTYPLLIIGNSLWAIALTFFSGADLALFYDSLKELGRETEYPRYRSTISVIDISATGLSGVIGSLLFRFSAELPFLLYLVMLLPMLLVILSLREPPMASGSDERPLRYRDILRAAGKTIQGRPILRNVLIYSNLLPVAGAAIAFTLIQPHAVNIGLPVEALGFIFLGISLVRIVGASSATSIAARLGDWRKILYAPILVVIGIVGLGFFPNLTGLMVYSLAIFANAAARPTIEDILMKETPSSVRATMLSFDSLIFRLLLAMISPFVGFVAESSSLSFAFMLLGVAVGVLLGVNLIFWARARTQLSGSTVVNNRNLD